MFATTVTCIGGSGMGLGVRAADDAARAPDSRPTSRPAVPLDSQATVIRFLEQRLQRDPDDITARNRLAGCYLRRFRESGDDRDLTLSAKAAAESLRSVPGPENTAGLAARAHAVFALHGFAAARDIGRQLVELEPDKRIGQEILGDALLELGDYAAAADAYDRMLKLEEGEPDLSTESRFARLALLRGDVAAAREHFDAAIEFANMITASTGPGVRAWCQVQAGQLAFNTGDWAGAETHYQAALSAKPQDWSAIDHLAELRAAQKRYGESVALYEALVGRVPRPELFQALGDVYATMGEREKAAEAHATALRKYRAAADAGSSHYFHHLAGFYSDVEPNPTEALKWARKDLGVRHSSYAYDGLAWALYQSGDYKAAAETEDHALIVPTKDAHLLYHASLIYYRAGDAAKGRTLLIRAGEANPRFNEFHVHR